LLVIWQLCRIVHVDLSSLVEVHVAGSVQGGVCASSAHFSLGYLGRSEIIIWSLLLSLIRSGCLRKGRAMTSLRWWPSYLSIVQLRLDLISFIRSVEHVGSRSHLSWLLLLISISSRTI
jgi:hypothetical protein